LAGREAGGGEEFGAGVRAGVGEDDGGDGVALGVCGKGNGQGREEKSGGECSADGMHGCGECNEDAGDWQWYTY
jgi:hypothetical protein